MGNDRSLEVLWSRVCALEKMIEMKRESDQRALSLQATEYERRLDMLNHAHAQAMERNAHYITRELYESRWIAHEETERAVHAKFDGQVATVERLVYIAVGAVLAIELALKFLV